MGQVQRHLYAIGVSHNVMLPDMLSCYSLKEGALLRASDILKGSEGVFGHLILSTCNRVEFYMEAESLSLARDAAKAAAALGGERDAGAFDSFAYAKTDSEAVEHIFKVASGLDSMMTGETEILGQVKAAYALFSERKTCTALLNRLFQKAIQAAKWVRTNTRIGRGKISIGSVASELAERIFDDLSSVRILLIGTGEAGGAVAEALALRGAGNITVASRTWERAHALALKVSGAAMPLELALEKLADFDVVVCATSAETPLITSDKARAAAAVRGGRAQFLIDLGLPRNIEENSDTENSYLYRLEDLSKIANGNMASRKADVEIAMEEIRRRAEYLSDRIFPNGAQNA